MKAVAYLVASLMTLAPVTSESPQRVEYCDLAKRPERFASKTVIVQARLTELKQGEWGLDSQCFQPTLITLPDDLQPKPDFQLEKSEGVRLMLQARRERNVLFRGDFVGRFDFAEQTAFGKSKVRTRLVLRDVQNAERITIPGK